MLGNFQQVIDNHVQTAIIKLKSFFLDKIDMIQSEILEIEIAKDEEVEQLHKKRKNFYISKFVPAITILLITFAMFYILPHYKLWEKLSTGQEWALGLIVNFTTFLITAVYARNKEVSKQDRKG